MVCLVYSAGVLGLLTFPSRANFELSQQWCGHPLKSLCLHNEVVRLVHLSNLIETLFLSPSEAYKHSERLARWHIGMFQRPALPGFREIIMDQKMSLVVYLSKSGIHNAAYQHICSISILLISQLQKLAASFKVHLPFDWEAIKAVAEPEAQRRCHGRLWVQVPCFKTEALIASEVDFEKNESVHIHMLT